jgi:hypothetical protein
VLAVVADGIGGHRAGEVAAELAVETISQAVSGSDGLSLSRCWRRRSFTPASSFMCNLRQIHCYKDGHDLRLCVVIE